MSIELSALKRNSNLETSSNQFFDVIVIGGGITGAGIALDAASRGLKTLLMEKQDFASGTSSRSTKLIHGGLRYLKNYELKLVREVGKERKILLKNAPHLVYPDKMLLPLIKGGTYGKLATSFGLWLYDKLVKVSKEEKRSMLSKKETLEKEPLLNPAKVIGAGLYAEYRTDDARLTIEVIKTASECGAYCFNYTEVVDFLYEEKRKLKGIVIKDVIENKEYKLLGKNIVNATGPWVEELIKKDDDLKSKMLDHTKGIHIVIPFEKLPIKQPAYFDVGDSRMIFVIPREGNVYIGTTDTFYKSNIDQPSVTKDDVKYLLDAVNKMFPTGKISEADIISSWAGIRSLIAQSGKAPSEISRKDEIFLSDSGLITIAGGKLTGYRKMAEKVVDTIINNLKAEGEKFIKCKTENIRLSGGKFKDVETFKEYINNKTNEMSVFGFPNNEIIPLIYKYGSNADYIFEFALNIPKNDNHRLLRAELKYGVNYEGVVTISDFLIRRTGMLYFNTQKINSVLPIVTEELSRLLNWNEATRQKQLKNFMKEFENTIKFEN